MEGNVIVESHLFSFLLCKHDFFVLLLFEEEVGDQCVALFFSFCFEFCLSSLGTRINYGLDEYLWIYVLIFTVDNNLGWLTSLLRCNRFIEVNFTL